MVRTRSVLGVVAVGGVIGALARYAVDSSLPWPGPPVIPWGTFTINIVGSLALGLLIPAFAHRWRHPLLRPFLAIGVLGGFTTFSAFALQGLLLLETGDLGAAAAYLLGSVILGVIAAQLGIAITTRRLAPAPPAGSP